MRSLSLSKFAVWIILVLVTLEVLSLSEWALFPYLPDDLAFFTNLDAGFFTLVLPLSPLLLLMMLYAWVFEGARFSKQYSQRFERALEVLVETRDKILRWIVGSQPSNREETRFFRYSRTWLLVALCSAVLIVYTPYRIDLNPTQIPVGIDTPLYIGWIDQMLTGSIGQAVAYAFGIANHGSRPFLLILLYVGTFAFGVSSVQIVEYLPIVLAPLLAISSFLLVRAGSKSENTAVLAAFLTTLSFPITVGMWAGYYANWLALIETNLFLASFLITCRSFSKPHYAGVLALSLALLLTHPWTWALVLVLTITFALSMWRTLQFKRLITLLVPLLLTNLLVDAAKSYFFGSWGIATYVGVRASGSGPLQLAGFWQNLVQGLVFTYDGLLSNSVILLFAFLGALSLKRSDVFDRLLILWTFLASLVFPFLASYNQTRIVYDLPIPVLASIGALLFISRFKSSKTISVLILLLIVLFNANYAIRTMVQLSAAIP